MNKKHIEEEKPMTREEKIKLSKRGKDAGIIAAGTGASAYALGKIAERGAKRAHASERLKAVVEKGGHKALKAGGIALGATGLALTGVSAYKHHKYKKEDDNTEE